MVISKLDDELWTARGQLTFCDREPIDIFGQGSSVIEAFEDWVKQAMKEYPRND